MKNYSIQEIQEKYDLELDKVINQIKKQKAKLVLLQFADGLKPCATTIVDFLDEKFKGRVEFLIWLGSCFGACDTPTGIDNLEIDLVVQVGHNEKMPCY